MARRVPKSVLTALEIDAEAERWYYQVAPVSGHTLEGAAHLLQLSVEELLGRTAGLRAAGLLQVQQGRVVVPPLAEAVARLVRREAETAGVASARLERLAAAVPQLVASSTRPSPDDLAEVQPLDGELSVGGDPLMLLTDMIRNSSGDMLWLRPDAWRMPRESAVSKVLAEAIAQGRASRAIYPVRARAEAPEALLTRAQAGEQIRLISDLPTRMFILGDSHAVLPEPLGFADEPRVHVRQRSLVAALQLWFESLWDAAVPVPELDLGTSRPDLRRFLLEQLAEGRTDEQIAPKLGMSLRTVRRRVATLMDDLGAGTRFQAGVEAVRRGWL